MGLWHPVTAGWIESGWIESQLQKASLIANDSVNKILFHCFSNIAIYSKKNLLSFRLQSNPRPVAISSNLSQEIS